MWILVFSLCEGWSHYILSLLLGRGPLYFSDGNVWSWPGPFLIGALCTSILFPVSLCNGCPTSNSWPPMMLHGVLRDRPRNLTLALLWFPTLLDLDFLSSHFLGSTLLFLKISLYVFGSGFWLGKSFRNKLFQQYWRHILSVNFEQTSTSFSFKLGCKI